MHLWRMVFQLGGGGGGPPNADDVVGEAHSTETAVGLPLSARRFNLAIGGPPQAEGS